VRFTIMQGAVQYDSGEAEGEPAVLPSQDGRCLRLLLLNKGKHVSADYIAEHLGQGRRRPIGPSSVPAYIGRVRKAVGRDRIRERPTYGYACDALPEDVDAFVYEASVLKLGICDLGDIDSADQGIARQYDQLLQLDAMWHRNPVDGFEASDDDSLVLQYQDFERYSAAVSKALVYSEINSRQRVRLEKAVTRLNLMLRRGLYDEEEDVWALLVRCIASLSASPDRPPSLVGKEFEDDGGRGLVLQPWAGDRLSEILRRVQERYDSGSPRRLAYMLERLRRGDADLLFPVESRRPAPSEEVELDQLMRLVGVTTSSALELHDSKLTPIHCMRLVQSRLWVSGILATKWVGNPYSCSELNKLLDKLDENAGTARFLLIDPASESYGRFNEQRYGDEDARPLVRLQELVARHSSLEVRLYDALPTFRLVFIDSHIVTFSPYVLDSELHGSKSGWDAPGIALDPTAPWPLGRTFETLFSETWRSSRALPPSGERIEGSPG
jgi:hypothetical protein